MIDFLASMTSVAGALPMIGDADDGYVVQLAAEPGFCRTCSLIATGAVLFERPDLAAKAGALDGKTATLAGRRGRARGWRQLAARGRAGFRPRMQFSRVRLLPARHGVRDAGRSAAAGRLPGRSVI